jgi:hypothetical protein
LVPLIPSEQVVIESIHYGALWDLAKEFDNSDPYFHFLVSLFCEGNKWYFRLPGWMRGHHYKFISI